MQQRVILFWRNVLVGSIGPIERRFTFYNHCSWDTNLKITRTICLRSRIVIIIYTETRYLSHMAWLCTSSWFRFAFDVTSLLPASVHSLYCCCHCHCHCWIIIRKFAHRSFTWEYDEVCCRRRRRHRQHVPHIHHAIHQLMISMISVMVMVMVTVVVMMMMVVNKTKTTKTEHMKRMRKERIK